MRTHVRFASLTVLLATATLAAPVQGRQETSPAHAHIGHVGDAFRGTPETQGLLPTAVAEAEIAHQHATLAARDPASLDGMQRHASHVLHALDPSTAESGPGQGYGVIEAATRAAHHIELAAGSAGASDGVKTHANHVATAAKAAVGRAEEAVDVAEDIQEAESAEEAAELLERLTTLTDAIVNGVDADGDGRVGWQEGEGGLAQATQHLGLLKRGEGLGG
jgi:hypothetical protein